MQLGVRRFVLLVVGVLALMSMGLAACGTSSTAGTPAPDSKQILHFPLVNDASDLKTLDPGRIQDFYSQQVAMLMFPPLMVLDDNLNTVPFAADGQPTISADGLTYTFKIKSGLKWTDGTPIDANTYAYSLNRSLDPCTIDGSATFLYPIAGAAAFNGSQCDAPASDITQTDSKTLVGKSIVATDAQTLTVTLGAPAAYFVPALTVTQAFAQPKQLIQQYGLKEWINHLADNGGFGGSLFKLTSWPHTGTLTLTRNDSQTVFPKPKLREIDYTVYKLGETMEADYKTGRLDTTGATNDIPASSYTQVKTQADFHQIPYQATDYFEPNWDRAPFDNLLAREAFALAINKDAIATNIAHGSVFPTWHMVPKGSPGYDNNLTGVQGAPTTGNTQLATQDINQYAAQACGGQLSKCPPVTFETDNSTEALKTSQAYLQMWQAAMPGYPITLHNVDFNTLLTDVFGASSGAQVPQLFGLAYSLDYPDPQDWLALQFGPGSIPYLAGVSKDTTLQTDMQKCDSEQAPARYADCNAAEQEAVNQVVWVMTDQRYAYWQTHSNVHGYVDNGAGMPSVLDWQNNIYITQ